MAQKTEIHFKLYCFSTEFWYSLNSGIHVWRWYLQLVFLGKTNILDYCVWTNWKGLWFTTNNFYRERQISMNRFLIYVVCGDMYFQAASNAGERRCHPLQRQTGERYRHRHVPSHFPDDTQFTVSFRTKESLGIHISLHSLPANDNSLSFFCQCHYLRKHWFCLQRVKCLPGHHLGYLGWRMAWRSFVHIVVANVSLLVNYVE